MNEQEVRDLIETDAGLTEHLAGKCRVAIVGNYLVHRTQAGKDHLLDVGDLYALPEGEWDCGFGKLALLMSDDMLSQSIERHRPFIEWYEMNDGHNPTFSQGEAELRDALASLLRGIAEVGGSIIVVEIVEDDDDTPFFSWPGSSGASGSDGDEE